MSQEPNVTKGANFERVKSALVYLQNLIVFRLILYKNRERIDTMELLRLGSPFGGWWIPIDTERYRVKALVSAGLGFDTSFDEELLKRGWYVLGIDPLEECCTIAEEKLSNFPKFEVLNVGLSVEDGYQTFFQPKNPIHDSWSTINAQSVVDPLSKDFPVISLKGLIGRHKGLADADYRYLKMDIEGAELALFQQALGDFTGFDFLAVELDFLALIPFSQFRLRVLRIRLMRKILRELKEEGWDLFMLKTQIYSGESPDKSLNHHDLTFPLFTLNLLLKNFSSLVI